MSESTFTGVLELEGRRGGRLRKLSLELDARPDDPAVSPDVAARLKLRDACLIECTVRPGGRGAPTADAIRKINGMAPEKWIAVQEF